MVFRSNDILKRPEGGTIRCKMKALGMSDEELEGPIIGIANSWSEIVPGHFNLRKVAEEVKKGIYRAGGTAVEFGVIAVCDGIANGHDGAHYVLPSRELIVNDVETMVEAHRLDGIVLLGSCDKIVPGMLMAAARLKIPAIFLGGGPMLGGAVFDGKRSDTTSMAEAMGMLKINKITEDTYCNLENVCGPTCGSCAFLGTANTMCCMGEALGLSLPGAALVPAVYSERLRLAKQTGMAIVNMVRKGITSDKIITMQSLQNAIRVLMATGGSTNGVLHLTAIAHEAGIDAETMMAQYELLSKSTPHIAKVNPAAKYDMEDFYKAGGIPKVMQEIQSLLNEDCLTVTGRTVKENLDSYEYQYEFNPDIIRSIEHPFNFGKGLAILRGNLAPDTCVTKPAAIDPALMTFTGTAKVFDSEEQADAAILDGQIHDGDVVVIRYEGPKGGPGIREMYRAMKYLYGMGLAKTTALITDGRFSGTNNGCFVGHISPEAADGGPLAAVHDGDSITIDIPHNTLTLHVSDEEIQQRLVGWKRPKPKFTKGWLGVYSKLASSAAQGAIIKCEE
jgi:dihydroxy-acid dehydratase